MPRVIAVIPARMGASRFPGKPLASICGRPMLEHVFRRTAACPALDDVWIATPDDIIVQAAAKMGARAVLTSPLHARATDRVAEAIGADPADLIVMVQGDEPMLQPAQVALVIDAMRADASVSCVNLVAAITTESELLDRNTIKVVVAQDGDALYFSRAPIPEYRAGEFAAGQWQKQVCIIGFRREALDRFTALPPTPLEVAESIDMLRLLEHGYRVRMVETHVPTQAVDTPADLARVEALLAADPATAAFFGDG